MESNEIVQMKPTDDFLFMQNLCKISTISVDVKPFVIGHNLMSPKILLRALYFYLFGEYYTIYF